MISNCTPITFHLSSNNLPIAFQTFQYFQLFPQSLSNWFPIVFHIASQLLSKYIPIVYQPHSNRIQIDFQMLPTTFQLLSKCIKIAFPLLCNCIAFQSLSNSFRIGFAISLQLFPIASNCIPIASIGFQFLSNSFLIVFRLLSGAPVTGVPLQSNFLML